MRGDSAHAGGEGRPPLLRVVRGEATAEETAALIAALALARAAAQRAAAQRAAGAAHGGRSGAAVLSSWCDRPRLLGAPISHGPGAWRASALPR